VLNFRVSSAEELSISCLVSFDDQFAQPAGFRQASFSECLRRRGDWQCVCRAHAIYDAFGIYSLIRADADPVWPAAVFFTGCVTSFATMVVSTAFALA